MLYTSRYQNPELLSGDYTTVRISLGTPKWSLGYIIDAVMPDLMPYGLLGKYPAYEPFKQVYFQQLDCAGVERIASQLNYLESYGKDVVLLCYEDIRRSEVWCHRRAFAEWWERETGVSIPELPDQSPVKCPKGVTSGESFGNQMSLF